MTMQSHVAELSRRHQSIEQQIEEAQAHPGIDSLELAKLKRKKLQLKDEIARLSGENVH